MVLFQVPGIAGRSGHLKVLLLLGCDAQLLVVVSNNAPF
jgi:hypothetical protein